MKIPFVYRSPFWSVKPNSHLKFIKNIFFSEGEQFYAEKLIIKWFGLVQWIIDPIQTIWIWTGFDYWLVTYHIFYVQVYCDWIGSDSAPVAGIGLD